MSITKSFLRLALLGACFGALPFAATAAPKTICTITVNSPDEQAVFRRNLPPGDYRFVELVERGRKDWLRSACEQKVQCDSLIISGHFDDGDEFYTDRFDVSEYLTVLEMERASCSDSCPGVFSQLKEVYLFGCNTLKTEPRQVAGGEITRALLRAGQSPAEAAKLSALLGEKHARSNRDRMRHIFKDVPVIYGFSSKAPLGKYAGPLLEKYFQTAPAGEVGSGQVSQKLLQLFGPSSMTVTTGLRDSEMQASARVDACRFVDDRVSPTQKVDFVHQMLKRDMSEVRMFIGDLERFTSSFPLAQRLQPEIASGFNAIAGDQATRERYLTFARDADEPAIRTRMMALATKLGWLTPAQEQAEFVRMIAERMARDSVGMEEVNLACARGGDGERDPTVQPLVGGALRYAKVGPAAALACLGSAQARARVVKAVTSDDTDEITIARAYLRQRPLADASEVRAVATAIGRMPASGAQVRAIETLAQQRVSDPESLREIARLFPQAKSLQVQRAIAALLIRADHRVLGQGELSRSLKQHRLKSPDGDDVIDALIRVLQAG
ncbi:hypothetical protein [Ramlibacter albus]|uniref:HEAT repeat domain-containing protein n=1 Tax=Ramlibacter albus TaxID=2079448 RepID=A0A923MD37_9BURK|nr:hypothetical protein [Ramlibacter albus]MBC5767099.1 hypothetical protein [Ramlibacter albus]